MRQEVDGSTAAVLQDVAFRICSWQHTAFLCDSHLAFSLFFVSIHVVPPYSSINTVTSWKKFCFILSDKSDSHLIDNLSIALHAFVWCMLTSLSVDKMCLL